MVQECRRLRCFDYVALFCIYLLGVQKVMVVDRVQMRGETLNPSHGLINYRMK